MNESILVKTKTNLSFTGTCMDECFDFQGQKCILLKPSENSNIVLIIPISEIIRTYTMEGDVHNYV